MKNFNRYPQLMITARPVRKTIMMKRSAVIRACQFALVAIAGLAVLSYAPRAEVQAANVGATILPSAEQPLVNLKSRQTLRVTYAGSAAAVAALRAGTATPTALAAADFDADGAMDVVAGYSTNNGGVLALLRGNPDAFAPKDLSLYKKAVQGSVPPTFLSKASVVAVPESPDLLVTGDFNRDGRKDVLVASRDGALYFLAGDGHGSLLAPQAVSLSGEVTALAVTGDGHVAVSIDGASGPRLVILSPSSDGLTPGASYTLPARGDAVAWGDLGGGADVAVGAGGQVVMIYDALGAHPQTETVSVPLQVLALALGDFIWDRDGRTEISLLASDGTIHILQHGTLNTTALTAADARARRAALHAKNKEPRNPTSLGAWTVAKQLPYTGSAPAGPVSPSAFSSPRLASSATYDLMVTDTQRSQLHILDTSGKTASPSADISLSAPPVAALALPQTIDAGRDLVVLTTSEAAPLVIHFDSSFTYVVSTTADVDSVGACTNPAITTAPSPLSLREAICVANNNAPASSTINLGAGTYDLTSLETGELQVGNASSGYSLSIVGTASAANTIIQQTDGVDRIFEEDFYLVGNNPFSISNVTLTGGYCTNNTTNDCTYGGGAVLAGAIAGDDLTVANVVMEGNAANPSGGQAGGGPDNGGALNFASPNLTITNSTFSTNTASGAGGGVDFDYNVTSVVTVTNSIFTGNIAGIEGGGFYLELEPGATTANISGSTFTGNNAQGGAGGGGIYEEQGGLTSASFTVSNSRFDGTNKATAGGTAVSVNTGTVATLTDNWWGCNGGPNTAGCDTLYVEPPQAGNPTTVGNYSPWLVLSIGASPTQVLPHGTSTLTADLTHDSNANGGFSVPDGTGVAFGATLGTDNPTSSIFTSGQATSTFTAGAPTGAGSGTATVDNQTVSVTINVMQSTTSTSVSSSLSPSAYGQSVTLTATVSSSAGTPTGTVTFKNGSVTLGNKVTLVGGVATLTTSALHLGTESITAAYFGNAKYSGSTSSPLGQMVNPATTTVGLTSSPNPSTVGQSVMFTATVAPQFSGTPQGKVKFMNGTKALGTVTLAGGMATLSKPFLGAGTKSITAVFFSGSADFSGSTSPILSQVVN